MVRLSRLSCHEGIRAMKTVMIKVDSEEIGALLEQARDEDVIVRMDDVSEFY